MIFCPYDHYNVQSLSLTIFWHTINFLRSSALRSSALRSFVRLPLRCSRDRQRYAGIESSLDGTNLSQSRVEVPRVVAVRVLSRLFLSLHLIRVQHHAEVDPGQNEQNQHLGNAGQFVNSRQVGKHGTKLKENTLHHGCL